MVVIILSVSLSLPSPPLIRISFNLGELTNRVFIVVLWKEDVCHIIMKSHTLLWKSWHGWASSISYQQTHCNLQDIVFE